MSAAVRLNCAPVRRRMARTRIYSREEIIRNVWGDEVVVSQRTIDTNITRLRKKLGDYDKYIITRQGFGYGFSGAAKDGAHAGKHLADDKRLGHIVVGADIESLHNGILYRNS